MNDDLISRKALKESIRKRLCISSLEYLTEQEKVIVNEIDNAPTVEPCYQTTSCLDCKMYDKKNHHCPRFCEVIRESVSEVKERPKGEWEYNQYDGNPNIGNWHCSECRYIDYGGGYNQKPHYNFCPNCGADMRGEGNE